MLKQETVNKIKGLKPAQSFNVATNNERKEILIEAKKMKRYGAIRFAIVSRSNDDGSFRIGAL